MDFGWREWRLGDTTNWQRDKGRWRLYTHEDPREAGWNIWGNQGRHPDTWHGRKGKFSETRGEVNIQNKPGNDKTTDFKLKVSGDHDKRTHNKIFMCACVAAHLYGCFDIDITSYTRTHTHIHRGWTQIGTIKAFNKGRNLANTGCKSEHYTKSAVFQLPSSSLWSELCYV